MPDGPQQDVFTAFGTATAENGLVPYLDYATPTFYDTLGAALQDLLGREGRRRRSSSARWRRTTRRSPRATGEAEASRGRAAGRAARGRLPLRAAGASWSTRRSCSSRSGARCSSRCTTGTGSPLGTWAGLGNYAAVLTDPELRAAFGHALVLIVFYAVLPMRHRAGAGRDPQPRQGARARVLPHRAVPAAGGRDGRGGGRLAAGLRPRRPAQRRCSARSGSTR